MITLELPQATETEREAWQMLSVSRVALVRFLREAQSAVGVKGEVAVLLAGDKTLRRLNKQFRGKDKATDVLSFPPAELAAAKHGGDLAISFETAQRQADEHEHSLGEELRVLMLHGLLHLKRMDHETDDGEMAEREARLRKKLKLPVGLIARVHEVRAMNMGFSVAVLGLLCLLALAAYIDRIYFEMGKFLSRNYTENIDAWETGVEPRLRLSRESAAMSASVLRQIALGALAFLLAIRLHGKVGIAQEIARSVFELLLVMLIFDRLIPQLFFTRTSGQWITRIAWLVQGLFYVVLPVTLTIGLLLSIGNLAKPEAEVEETPSEAMDALLEAGEEEGVLDEEDRELVRSVVEFGDKVVREVMTPRAEMFAVPGTMSLEKFTAEINDHSFSRVPVYGESLDSITGIAFSRDLLGVKDAEAAKRTVAELQRSALYIPESKKVNELLREMQREKQHMSIVIDEYGGVAGLVTIEDLLEAIVGNIEDEHDRKPDEHEPVEEPDGAYLVPGSFEVSRLRELFESDDEECIESKEDCEEIAAAQATTQAAEDLLPSLLAKYEATTVGGLVSEIAGHIPLPGEVVEDGPLRLEVVASTDRLVERVRVGLTGVSAAPEASEAE